MCERERESERVSAKRQAMKWTRYQCTYGEPPPSARCGHCVARVKSSVWDGTLVVFHAGTNDRQFLNDLVVLHLESGLWSRPAIEGGPSPRAFQCCSVLGTNIYYFGGRTGARMHSEIWKLDTNLWEWTLLQMKGPKPDAREKADCIALDETRILIFGGYDGFRWLNDLFTFDVQSSECLQLKPSGSLPPPRSGHKLAMLHQGLVLFGGETTNTAYLSDLWALKGIYDGLDTPRWVKLQLSGPSPSGRSGHGFVNAGARMVVYGGRGDEGWISRKTIYHKDVSVIDRESVRWVKTSSFPEEPSERAFHSLTSIGQNRILLFGGYNGKSTYGDMWFLEVNDEAMPTGNGEAATSSQSKVAGTEQDSKKFDPTFGIFGNMLKSTFSKETVDESPEWMQTNSSNEKESMLGCLRQRAGLPRKATSADLSKTTLNDDVKVKLLKIAIKVDPNLPKDQSRVNLEAALARARSFFSTVSHEDLTSDDVQVLLHDFKCILPSGLGSLRQKGKETGYFGKWNPVYYADIKLSEVPELLTTYRELLSATLGM